MKKILFTLLIILFAAAKAETVLKGGVVNSVVIEKVRQETFKDLPRHLKMRNFPKLDPQRVKNLQARAEKEQCFPDHMLNFFSNGQYAVSDIGSLYSYYYNKEGRLLKVEVSTKPFEISVNGTASEYPLRTAQYAYPKGNLLITRQSVAAGEDYTFQPDGSLASYCAGNTCYKPDGSIINTRHAVLPCPQTDIKTKEQ